MPRPFRLPVLAVCLSLATAQVATAAPAGTDSTDLGGVWRNPQDSVHVEIRPCADAGHCGYVVWADERAQADARRGGTARLVGLEVFRNLARDASGRWRGKVFAPDLNVTLQGAARLLDAHRLQAKGCLFGDLLCKSQVWTRVDGGAPPQRS